MFHYKQFFEDFFGFLRSILIHGCCLLKNEEVNVGYSLASALLYYIQQSCAVL